MTDDSVLLRLLCRYVLSKCSNCGGEGSFYAGWDWDEEKDKMFRTPCSECKELRNALGEADA